MPFTGNVLRVLLNSTFSISQVTIDANTQPMQNYSDSDLEYVGEVKSVKNDNEVKKVKNVKVKSAPRRKLSYLEKATCPFCQDFITTDEPLMKFHIKLVHSSCTSNNKELSGPSGSTCGRRIKKARCKVCSKIVTKLREHCKKVHMDGDDYKCRLCYNSVKFTTYHEYLAHVQKSHWNTKPMYMKPSKPMPQFIANFLAETSKPEN
jgi:hypothetical protein